LNGLESRTYPKEADQGFDRSKESLILIFIDIQQLDTKLSNMMNIMSDFATTFKQGSIGSQHTTSPMPH
jgi:hypothetical protein